MGFGISGADMNVNFFIMHIKLGDCSSIGFKVFGRIWFVVVRVVVDIRGNRRCGNFVVNQTRNRAGLTICGDYLEIQVLFFSICITGIDCFDELEQV